TIYLVDDGRRPFQLVQQSLNDDHINGGRVNRQRVWRRMHEPPGLAPQFEVLADEPELFLRRAARQYGRAVTGVLEPIGAEPFTEPEERLAGVAVKFEDPRDPVAVTGIALPFDLLEPR